MSKNKALSHIINVLRAEGKDYSDFKTLLPKIKESNAQISKDELIDFLSNDFRIQLYPTPNAIAKLIAQIAVKENPVSAIDVCCGSGNILNYLHNTIGDLTGVEIVENVASLAKFLIPDSTIITADTFEYPFSKKYDLAVGSVPFGSRVEFNGKRLPIEEAFIRKAFDLLNENGTLILLIPYSMLGYDVFQQFRKDFIPHLKEIVSLPSGSIRNTNIKTALLVLSKNESKEVMLSQLQQIDNLNREYEDYTPVTFSKEKLIERWDPEFQLAQKKGFYTELESYQTKELKDLAEIIKGKMISADTLQPEGDYLYLKPVHIQKDGLSLDSGLKYVAKEALSQSDSKYIIQKGDIIFSTIFNDLRMYVYQSDDVLAIASNNIAIIRSSKYDYILSYLQTDEGKRIFKTQAEDLRKGVTISHISIKDIASIKIPILPVADLNTLGDVSISRSTEAQLREALVELSKYKNQVQILEKEKENLSEFKAFIENRFNSIESKLEVMNNKLDDLLPILKELKTEFEEIQKLPREEEEKLFKLYQKIDAKLDNVYSTEVVTIERYIEEIKQWLYLWESLDIQSQKFLPIAEFIFDQLSRVPEADYSPFVVQYCRTLENEILKKLFEAYHTNGLKDVKRDDLVFGDLDHSNTRKFAKMVQSDDKNYTLGEMNFIIALLKDGGKTLQKSMLLQHFKAFAVIYFDEKILEESFLNDIQTLTQDFRNKAAHPNTIGIDIAKQCQELLRKSLNVFLESLKNR